MASQWECFKASKVVKIFLKNDRHKSGTLLILHKKCSIRDEFHIEVEMEMEMRMWRNRVNIIADSYLKSDDIINGMSISWSHWNCISVHFSEFKTCCLVFKLLIFILIMSEWWQRMIRSDHVLFCLIPYFSTEILIIFMKCIEKYCLVGYQAHNL